MSQISDKSIEDTGERMIPAYHKGKLVYGEHIVRYEAAAQIVKDKVVLDIASGSGYGTALMGGRAKKVYGVDVDEDAIAYAKKNYGSATVEFKKGDGKDIPLETNSVDVVVSFETIEHIENYQHFMAEVKRVLKGDGLFILSTPNDKEFPEGAHFHIHEFERRELQDLAKKYFKNSKEYFQATWQYNALLDEKQLKSEWKMEVQTMHTAPVKADKAIYFYMLLANREIHESVRPLAAISEHWSDRRMLEHNNEMDTYIRDTITHYEGILKEKDKQFLKLYSETEKLHHELDAVKKTLAWKLKQSAKTIRHKVHKK